MITNVMKAKATLEAEAKSSAPCPPAILFNATGNKEIPIIETTEPVTTGGKNFTSLPKKPAIIITITPEAIIEP